MKTLIDNGAWVVAFIGTVAVFILSRRALERHDALGNPTALALCTAGLSFFGMLSLGPYVLLTAGVVACACLVLPLLLSDGVRTVFSRSSRRWPQDTNRGTTPRLDDDSKASTVTALDRAALSTVTTARVSTDSPQTAQASRTRVRANASEPIIPLEIVPPNQPRS